MMCIGRVYVAEGVMLGDVDKEVAVGEVGR